MAHSSEGDGADHRDASCRPQNVLGYANLTKPLNLDAEQTTSEKSK